MTTPEGGYPSPVTSNERRLPVRGRTPKCVVKIAGQRPITHKPQRRGPVSNKQIRLRVPSPLLPTATAAEPNHARHGRGDVEWDGCQRPPRSRQRDGSIGTPGVNQSAVRTRHFQGTTSLQDGWLSGSRPNHPRQSLGSDAQLGRTNQRDLHLVKGYDPGGLPSPTLAPAPSPIGTFSVIAAPEDDSNFRRGHCSTPADFDSNPIKSQSTAAAELNRAHRGGYHLTHCFLPA